MAHGGSPSTRTARATRLAEPLARLARPVGGKEGSPRGRWRRSVKAARMRQCPRGFESHAARSATWEMAQDRADVTMSRWLSIADLIEATTVAGSIRGLERARHGAAVSVADPWRGASSAGSLQERIR